MRKLVSIILSIMILCSVAVAVPAFAADNSYAKETKITAEDILKPFTAMEGELTFSDSVSLIENSVEFPHINDIEFNKEGNGILFNSTNLENYDIKSDKVVLSAQFNVLQTVTGAPAEAKITDIYYIEGTEFKEFEGLTLPYKLKAEIEVIGGSETTENTTATASETSATQGTTSDSSTSVTQTSETESTEVTSSTAVTTTHPNETEETTKATESTATQTAPSTTESKETTETTVAPATNVPTTAPTTAAPKPKPTQTPTVKPANNLGPGADEKAVDLAIKNLKNDSDPKGSKFGVLKAKAAKTTKTSITVSWTKVKGAKKYIVYSNKCGKTKGKINAYKLIKTTTAKSIKLTKINGKKIVKGTYYKFLIVAVNSKGKVVSTSKTIHVATKGGKVTNYKSIKLNASSKALKKGKTFKVKVTSKTKQVKKASVKNHRSFKYESSNTKIATVSSKGKIKAKKKGTCYVYVYAQNGVYKRIKIKVK